MASQKTAIRTGAFRIALLSVTSLPNKKGGVERLYEGLLAALKNYNIAIDEISVPVSETSFGSILNAYLQIYDLDLSKYDAVVSTKAPGFMVRHRNHVCYLAHTIRIFYDMYDSSVRSTALACQRKIIQLLDYAALSNDGLKALYCVGTEVQLRIRKHINVDSKVMYHPSTLASVECQEGHYLFLPGRLHKWKRVDMIVGAYRRMKTSIPLIISGNGEEENNLRDLAKDLPGVRFVGHRTDEQLARLYAGALAVIFCPIREDYGLVTVEAFSSRKPVVTCRDSGEPARLVADGFNGLICHPSELAIAKRLDWLVTNKSAAKIMGENGFTSAGDISWQNVCDNLLTALGYQPQFGE